MYMYVYLILEMHVVLLVYTLVCNTMYPIKLLQRFYLFVVWSNIS